MYKHKAAFKKVRSLVALQWLNYFIFKVFISALEFEGKSSRLEHLKNGISIWLTFTLQEWQIKFYLKKWNVEKNEIIFWQIKYKSVDLD